MITTIIMRTLSILAWLGAASLFFDHMLTHVLAAMFLAGMGYVLWVPSATAHRGEPLH